jgi:hypothetical protein
VSNVLDKILNLDRRWTFLFIAVAAVLPFLWPMGLAIHPTKEVINVYDAVEALAGTGKPLVISFDFDPGTDAELGPMNKALLIHAFTLDIPVVVINFTYTGTALAELRLKEVADPMGKVYGVDYAYLGNKPAYANVMINLSKDLRLSYSTDYYNTPIDDLPILQGLKNYDDFGLVICLAGTQMVEFWIIYGQGPYGFKYALGCTAVSATDMYPYLQTGQALGMIGGMKGAAEYEQLLVDHGINAELGDAARGLDSQSLCHLVIIAFILMGNIAHFLTRRRGGA